MSINSIIIHGHLLKEAREDLNLSAEDVARKLTLNEKHIISMEENKNDGFISFQIKLISIRKYAAFLELDIHSIIENYKNSPESFYLTNSESTQDIDMAKNFSSQKKLFLSRIRLFFLWVNARVKISYIFYFIIFLFASNFLIGIYQKYAISQRNFEGQEVDLANVESLPNDIATYEIKPIEEKKELRQSPSIEINKAEFNKKDIAMKMCGKIISKPIAQISSPTDPLKPGDYFHIISKGQQTICITDARGKEDVYSLNEGQKLTYRGGQAPFKLLTNPAISEIFYEGWLIKLTPEQNFIQLNPKTYN